jgi:hypothetical protein
MTPATPMPIDLSGFDAERNDHAKIEDGLWVPCRICESAFRRLRLTLRYCATCGRGFCEGEHGNFAPKSPCGALYFLWRYRAPASPEPVILN